MTMENKYKKLDNLYRQMNAVARMNHNPDQQRIVSIFNRLRSKMEPIDDTKVIYKNSGSPELPKLTAAGIRAEQDSMSAKDLNRAHSEALRKRYTKRPPPPGSLPAKVITKRELYRLHKKALRDNVKHSGYRHDIPF